MENKELIVRPSRFFAIFNLGGMTIAVCTIAYELRNDLFNWKKFHQDAEPALVFFVIFLVWIWTWIAFFDRRPKLKINSAGIWKRNNFYLFSIIKNISWNEIQYFYLLSKTDKGWTTKTLILHKIDSEEDFKIALSDTDVDDNVIIDLVKEYSLLFNFSQLSDETS